MRIGLGSRGIWVVVGGGMAGYRGLFLRVKESLVSLIVIPRHLDQVKGVADL